MNRTSCVAMVSLLWAVAAVARAETFDGPELLRPLDGVGVGAKVRVKSGGKLLGFRGITLCGGYSGTRPALAHFGLGANASVDLEVEIPGKAPPIKLTGVRVDQALRVEEP